MATEVNEASMRHHSPDDITHTNTQSPALSAYTPSSGYHTAHVVTRYEQ